MTDWTDLSDHYVPEEVLDYDEIFRRGGRNLGDEDFALFKCPSCDRIYLIDYEVDTLYLDPDDLSRRMGPSASQDFLCQGCGSKFPETGAWIGPKAPMDMWVSWELLASSPWRWITRRTREKPGAPE